MFLLNMILIFSHSFINNNILPCLNLAQREGNVESFVNNYRASKLIFYILKVKSDKKLSIQYYLVSDVSIFFNFFQFEKKMKLKKLNC